MKLKKDCTKSKLKPNQFKPIEEDKLIEKKPNTSKFSKKKYDN